MNTPNQDETLLQSLEQATAGIGLHVDAHKTEYMCYNQTGDISTLGGTSLKLVDKFTCLGSSVSSTEKDIDTRLTKAWTAIDRLSIIWKSDLTDKMKRSFFQAAESNPLVTVPKAQITIGIIVTFMFHSFFSSLARSRYLSFFSHSFSLYQWQAGTVKSTILKILFFFYWLSLGLVFWPRLGDPFVSFSRVMV